MYTYNNIKYVQETIKRIVKSPKVIIDATCGNGNDTLFLAQQYKQSQIYAFDIQETAILNTQKRCKEYTNIKYIKDSHANILNYVEENIDLIIFNLGYLPYDNTSITTEFESTKKAIESAMVKLVKNGIIVITVYKGSENIEETNKLKIFLQNINKAEFIVSNYYLHNLSNAPENLVIERK